MLPPLQQHDSTPGSEISASQAQQEAGDEPGPVRQLLARLARSGGGLQAVVSGGGEAGEEGAGQGARASSANMLETLGSGDLELLLQVMDSADDEGQGQDCEEPCEGHDAAGADGRLAQLTEGQPVGGRLDGVVGNAATVDNEAWQHLTDSEEDGDEGREQKEGDGVSVLALTEAGTSRSRSASGAVAHDAQLHQGQQRWPGGREASDSVGGRRDHRLSRSQTLPQMKAVAEGVLRKMSGPGAVSRHSQQLPSAAKATASARAGSGSGTGSQGRVGGGEAGASIREDTMSRLRRLSQRSLTGRSSSQPSNGDVEAHGQGPLSVDVTPVLLGDSGDAAGSGQVMASPTRLGVEACEHGDWDSSHRPCTASARISSGDGGGSEEGAARQHRPVSALETGSRKQHGACWSAGTARDEHLQAGNPHGHGQHRGTPGLRAGQLGTAEAAGQSGLMSHEPLPHLPACASVASTQSQGPMRSIIKRSAAAVGSTGQGAGPEAQPRPATGAADAGSARGSDSGSLGSGFGDSRSLSGALEALEEDEGEDEEWEEATLRTRQGGATPGQASAGARAWAAADTRRQGFREVPEAWAGTSSATKPTMVPASAAGQPRPLKSILKKPASAPPSGPPPPLQQGTYTSAPAPAHVRPATATPAVAPPLPATSPVETAPRIGSVPSAPYPAIAPGTDNLGPEGITAVAPEASSPITAGTPATMGSATHYAPAAASGHQPAASSSASAGAAPKSQPPPGADCAPNSSLTTDKLRSILSFLDTMEQQVRRRCLAAGATSCVRVQCLSAVFE